MVLERATNKTLLEYQSVVNNLAMATNQTLLVGGQMVDYLHQI